MTLVPITYVHKTLLNVNTDVDSEARCLIFGQNLPICFECMFAVICSVSLPDSAIGQSVAEILTFPGHTHLFFKHICNFTSNILTAKRVIDMKQVKLK